MKYFKRLRLYKASNVTFDPSKIEARSYSWWVFVALINGKVVFNNYPYSNTTRRHQWKVRQLLEDLGIKIDFTIQSSASLNDSGWAQVAIKEYERQIKVLTEIIENPRTRLEKNLERAGVMKELQGSLYITKVFSKAVA